MTNNKPMMLLLALWAVVAFLAYYQKQNPSPTLASIYTASFLVVFVLSILHLYRRAVRKRPPQE